MEKSKGMRVLMQSDNIFKDILSPLSVEGDTPSVYFYRIIGCDNDQEKYLREIVELDENLKALGNYTFIDRKLKHASKAAIDAARKLLEQVPLKDYSNGAILNLLETNGLFSLTSDLQVNRRTKDAFGLMLNLYFTNEKPVNLSIVMNFVLKVLLWYVIYGKQVGRNSAYNPKILYWGSPKKHEIYLLILMSLIGCDVLVLNVSFNDHFNQVDKKGEFSLLVKKAKERKITDFPTRESLALESTNTLESTIMREFNKGNQRPKMEETRLPDARPRKREEIIEKKPSNYSDLMGLNEPAIVTKLKQADNIFEDILIPVAKRTGYVGSPLPILPVYFTRYLGLPASSDDWEAEYYNHLYNLDLAMKSTGPYLKFLDGIPTPSVKESNRIAKKLTTFSYNDRFEILVQILQANILPRTNNQLQDNTIRKACAGAVNLFAEKNSDLNMSMLLNFSLKLAAWFKRYLPKLLIGSNPNNGFRLNEHEYHYNPKILFYGVIKPHEIYLLYAFHKMGCDVLFIHSDEEEDRPLQDFDQAQSLTQVIRNEYNLPLTTFPQGERLIRKSTVAYKASKEIEEVIYSEEVGLFKPWQFESYFTQPITLKTTYDELKILWREPAKLRPEFKVHNKKVYIPNVFAKINGVSEDLQSYWRDIKMLSSAGNTRLLEYVPFTKVSYPPQELFQMSYTLNEQGFFGEEKVTNSRYYKFNHLKEPLQHFLIAKINELLSADMFLETMDVKFKLKILMTILTMDDSLLKLIEAFDYPQEIPKVMVYDNKKYSFSEYDAILLAYFNLVGFDIVIFTPTNYQTIEQRLKSSLFDIHQLPLVKYDLALPSLDSIAGTPEQKQGFLARFFKLT